MEIKETLKQLIVTKQVYQTPDGAVFETESEAVEYLFQKIMTDKPPSQISQFFQTVKRDVLDQNSRRSDPPLETFQENYHGR